MEELVRINFTKLNGTYRTSYLMSSSINQKLHNYVSVCVRNISASQWLMIPIVFLLLLTLSSPSSFVSFFIKLVQPAGVCFLLVNCFCQLARNHWGFMLETRKFWGETNLVKYWEIHWAIQRCFWMENMYFRCHTKIKISLLMLMTYSYTMYDSVTKITTFSMTLLLL